MLIAFVLGLLVLAIVLFATERYPVDVITLFLLVLLVGGGVLSPAEAFSGFSSDIIIILGSIFVISGALNETGLLDAAGRLLVGLAKAGPRRLLALIMGMAGGISAFMNNTTVAAMFLPPVIGIAKATKTSPSRLLMPLAYASILGGTCTLIGTSTNVAVSGYIARQNLPPLHFFEITPVGLIIVAIGILYMIFIGQRLLPDHPAERTESDYAMREYLSEIVILPESPLIGQRCFAWDLTALDFRILKLLRGSSQLDPSGDVTILAGDTLLVEGNVRDLMRVKAIEGIEIKGTLGLEQIEGEARDVQLAEVLVGPQASLIGRTLKRADFRRQMGLTVLAVHRHGHPLRDKIGDLTLRLGDVLLIEGAAERIEALRETSGLVVLDEHQRPGGKVRLGIYVALAFGTAIVAGAADWLPMSVAFLAAAIFTVLIGAVSIEKARASIDLRSLILIGGLTAFGTAMDKTGAADFLAHEIVQLLSPFGIMAVLAGFFVLTILLTQPMSNAAAALVVLPVAMSAAEAMGANPRTFGIAIMLAASISFITPLEPACLIVYGPGKYRFTDFVKVGGGLTLLLIPIVLLLIPVFWPLYEK